MTRQVFFKESSDPEALAVSFQAWLAQFPDCKIIEMKSHSTPTAGFIADNRYWKPGTYLSIFAVVEV